MCVKPYLKRLQMGWRRIDQRPVAIKDQPRKCTLNQRNPHIFDSTYPQAAAIIVP